MSAQARIQKRSQSWLRRLARRLGIPREPGPERTVIRVDSTALTVTDHFPNNVTRVDQATWNEINGVVAYKRDCFAVDLLCIGFATPHGTFETNEGMEGWAELIELLPTYLSGTPKPEEWREKVVQPPFATNATTVAIHGPLPAPMPRRAGKARAQLHLSALQRPPLQAALSAWMPQLHALKSARKVRWSLDVDPVDLY